MALEKNDLDQIEKRVKRIVESSAEETKKVLRKEIQQSAESTKTDLHKEVKGSAENTENRIIAVLSREITDLAIINHAVIQRVDKIAELEKRIIRLETRAGIR